MRMRPVPLLAFLLILAVALPVPAATRRVAGKPGSGAKPPIEVSVEAAESVVRVGAPVTVSATIVPLVTASRIRVRFEAEGAVAIDGPAVKEYPLLPAGRPLPFTFEVRFTGRQQSIVHVWADVLDAEGNLLYGRRGSLYTMFRGLRTYHSPYNFQVLERRIIADDLREGRITQEEAQRRRDAMRRVQGRNEAREPSFRPAQNANEERLNTLVGAPAEGWSGRKHDRVRTNAGDIIVQGNVSWTDENGATHPAYGANVDIMDDDTGPDEHITTVVTDTNGNYYAEIDQDDGFGAGDRDVYVEVRLANSWIHCENDDGDDYVITSAVHDETPTGTTINESFVTANTGNGAAMSVFVGATWIAAYLTTVHGSALGQVDVVWPYPGGGSFFDGDINIAQGDRWDWDTIHHEFGHYVQSELDLADNPGGPHNIGDCIAVTGGHDKDEGVRMAWAEGWPTYFGTSGQQVMGMASLNVPRVGDVSYQDLEDASLVYSLESQDNNGLGEDNEVAVQRMLWDLFDSANDGRDTLSRSHSSIWSVLDSSNAKTLSAGWNQLRSGQSTATNLAMGGIASDHVVGPTLVSPANNAVVSSDGPTFDWDARVGCSNTFAGNSFTVYFYRADTLAPVLTIPGLATSSVTLSAAQRDLLSSSGHVIRWAVEGSNTSDPSTGPYLGESFTVTINRPPTANAGPDVTAECTSYTTTAVALNGTGSSDPDGDTLTYTWSAPGVSFNDATSATPVGQFPEGTTLVTLKVSDGFATATDTVVVTVEDTTAPEIFCPVDVTAECTGNSGVDKNDPQLAAFFGGVSAIDICDSAITITNDAPNHIPLGDTVVTFTATDAAGNSSSCSATITVVDTSAPTIIASVTPTVLWPPNHKMRTINATVVVTDQCDPNPTFVLKSITSNEADNGLGDGDAANDVQGAAYGTADTQFQLRSERSGLGNDRIYTITYTGIDSSGNTTDTSVTVKVPHEDPIP
jgi:hypothetical protein